MARLIQGLSSDDLYLHNSYFKENCPWVTATAAANPTRSSVFTTASSDNSECGRQQNMMMLENDWLTTTSWRPLLFQSDNTLSSSMASTTSLDSVPLLLHANHRTVCNVIKTTPDDDELIISADSSETSNIITKSENEEQEVGQQHLTQKQERNNHNNQKQRICSSSEFRDTDNIGTIMAYDTSDGNQFSATEATRTASLLSTTLSSHHSPSSSTPGMPLLVDSAIDQQQQCPSSTPLLMHSIASNTQKTTGIVETTVSPELAIVEKDSQNFFNPSTFLLTSLPSHNFLINHNCNGNNNSIRELIPFTVRPRRWSRPDGTPVIDNNHNHHHIACVDSLSLNHCHNVYQSPYCMQSHMLRNMMGNNSNQSFLDSELPSEIRPCPTLVPTPVPFSPIFTEINQNNHLHPLRNILSTNNPPKQQDPSSGFLELPSTIEPSNLQTSLPEKHQFQNLRDQATALESHHSTTIVTRFTTDSSSSQTSMNDDDSSGSLDSTLRCSSFKCNELRKLSAKEESSSISSTSCRTTGHETLNMENNNNNNDNSHRNIYETVDRKRFWETSEDDDATTISSDSKRRRLKSSDSAGLSSGTTEDGTIASSTGYCCGDPTVFKSPPESPVPSTWNSDNAYTATSTFKTKKENTLTEDPSQNNTTATNSITIVTNTCTTEKNTASVQKQHFEPSSDLSSLLQPMTLVFQPDLKKSALSPIALPESPESNNLLSSDGPYTASCNSPFSMNNETARNSASTAAANKTLTAANTFTSNSNQNHNTRNSNSGGNTATTHIDAIHTNYGISCCPIERNNRGSKNVSDTVNKANDSSLIGAYQDSDTLVPYEEHNVSSSIDCYQDAPSYLRFPGLSGELSVGDNANDCSDNSGSHLETSSHINHARYHNDNMTGVEDCFSFNNSTIVPDSYAQQSRSSPTFKNLSYIQQSQQQSHHHHNGGSKTGGSVSLYDGDVSSLGTGDAFYHDTSHVAETTAASSSSSPVLLHNPTLGDTNLINQSDFTGAPGLESLSLEHRKLLRNIPRKSREAFSPSDLAAFRTCHPHYSRNCFILMQNGFDIRLGEVGRAALKKEISRRLKGDAQLRERCVTVVCRLKNANVLQLLQMAEIAGCLTLGLKISSCYWKEYSKKQQRPGGAANRNKTEARSSNTTRHSSDLYRKTLRHSQQNPSNSNPSLRYLQQDSTNLNGNNNNQRESSSTMLSIANGLPNHYENTNIMGRTTTSSMNTPFNTLAARSNNNTCSLSNNSDTSNGNNNNSNNSSNTNNNNTASNINRHHHSWHLPTTTSGFSSHYQSSTNYRHTDLGRGESSTNGLMVDANSDATIASVALDTAPPRRRGRPRKQKTDPAEILESVLVQTDHHHHNNHHHQVRSGAGDSDNNNLSSLTRTGTSSAPVNRPVSTLLGYYDTRVYSSSSPSTETGGAIPQQQTPHNSIMYHHHPPRNSSQGIKQDNNMTTAYSASADSPCNSTISSSSASRYIRFSALDPLISTVSQADQLSAYVNTPLDSKRSNRSNNVLTLNTTTAANDTIIPVTPDSAVGLRSSQSQFQSYITEDDYMNDTIKLRHNNVQFLNGPCSSNSTDTETPSPPILGIVDQGASTLKASSLHSHPKEEYHSPLEPPCWWSLPPLLSLDPNGSTENELNNNIFHNVEPGKFLGVPPHQHSHGSHCMDVASASFVQDIALPPSGVPNEFQLPHHTIKFQQQA